MPPKRKSVQAEEPAAEPSRRRSLRNTNKPSPVHVTEKAKLSAATPKVQKTKAEIRAKPNKRGAAEAAAKPVEGSEESASEPESIPKSEELDSEPEPPTKRSRSSRQQQQKQKQKQTKTKPSPAKEAKKPTTAKKSQKNDTSSITAAGTAIDHNDDKKPAAAGSGDSDEKNYWLMKAEPETRLENGVDVRFSIDDLRAKTEPEPWDGIRAYPARNNLRAMKKGDLAFFYHSNCKEPGIVGTMEVVREHTPDLSAHDPSAPYYDAKSKPDDPKWSVVHVEFRRKFAVPIYLKELRAMGDAAGKPLANMQMLKQSRLSVSRVSAAEWEYLMGVVEEKEKAASSG